MANIYLGFILNCVIGHFEYLTHPIIYIGHLIKFTETRLESFSFNPKLKGLVLLLSVAIVSLVVPYLVLKWVSSINALLGFFIHSFMIMEILAIKGLKQEPMKVFRAIKNNNIKVARKELSMLVTRDTSQMDNNQIVMSTVETIAENIVDGITAPLFYIFIGGAPLGFFYKAVNTLDSMVGYKNEKYMELGYYSAKFDDLLNYIPARLTGYLVVVASWLLKYDYKESLKVLKEDAKLSSSPNSGYSEAPVAGALHLYFGGKLKYFNKEVDKPKIGFRKDFSNYQITRCIKLMYYTSIMALITYTVAVYILGGFFGV